MTKDDEKAASGIDSVTDHHEEKDEGDADKAAGAMKEAMDTLQQKQSADALAERERLAELSKVTIDKADVDVLVREFELSAADAEMRLRESNGVLEAALKSCIN